MRNKLKNLISIVHEVLSSLFSSDEIKENIKESRFPKGYERNFYNYKYY